MSTPATPSTTVEEDSIMATTTTMTEYVPIAHPVLEAVAVLQEATTTMPTTVRVVAPSDLPAGYEMSVRIDEGNDGGRRLVVRVPEPGASKGRAFQAVVIRPDGAAEGDSRNNNNNVPGGGIAMGTTDNQDVFVDVENDNGDRHLERPLLGGGDNTRDNNNDDDDSGNIQTGSWRDGTRDWCALLWLTLCCPVVALGQVMTRLNLNMCARPRGTRGGTSACRGLAVLAVLYFAVTQVLVVATTLSLLMEDDDDHNDDGNKKRGDNDLPAGLTLFLRLLGASFSLYVCCLTMRTRSYVRRKYRIPEECCCVGCEDCLCAYCCPYLSIVQMSRHTGDFRTHRAALCSETGLVERERFVV